MDEKQKAEYPAEKSAKRTEAFPDFQQINESLPGNLIGMIEDSFCKMSKQEGGNHGV